MILMKHGSSEMSKIVITEVKGRGRTTFLPKHFGHIARAIIIEGVIYKQAGLKIDAYTGSLWIFNECSNGAAYMVPDLGDGMYGIVNADNFYDGKMSADAIGLALTTITINMFARKYQSKQLSTLWEKLMDVVAQHPERAELYKFLD